MKKSEVRGLKKTDLRGSAAWCAPCDKRAFPGRALAKADARERSKDFLRVYECPHRKGWWHQTSADASGTERYRAGLIFHKSDVPVTAADAERVARYVRSVVQVTGQGPVWSMISSITGWPKWLMPHIMAALQREGWVTYTRQAHSLRPGPKLEEEEEAAS